MLLIHEEEQRCKHPNLPEVKFDPEAARTMSSVEVRLFFPRLVHMCPDCKQSVIKYASEEHYYAGDW